MYNIMPLLTVLVTERVLVKYDSGEVETVAVAQAESDKDFSTPREETEEKEKLAVMNPLHIL